MILCGAALWREVINYSDSVHTIVIEKPVETETTLHTEKTVFITETQAVTINNTKKANLEKSTFSTKASLEAIESLETSTEIADLYIDINKADFSELVELKGVGDYLAGQIIAYREENGGFRNIEELINVSGIGEKIFDSIRDYVYVENPIYNYEETDEDVYYEPELSESEVAETVPTTEPVEVEEVTETETEFITENYFPINLNEADSEILMFLPYVDEEISESIIELRNNIGGFSNVYELLFIEGLTEEQVKEIIKYVYI